MMTKGTALRWIMALAAISILLPFASPQIIRRRIQKRIAEKMDQMELKGPPTPVNTNPASHCGAAPNVAFRIKTFSSGLRAAVWYPTNAAEESFQYANGFTAPMARDAAVADCGAKFPMVVFSHGYGGCSVQSAFFTEELARAGYIVVAPDHKDAKCKVDEKREGGFDRPEESFRDAAKWTDKNYTDRRDDVREILNEMPRDPQFGAWIDQDRMGMAGHSLGGYTAAGMAGAWPSWKDPRIKAVLLFSPFVDPYLKNNTIHNLSVPVMYQGGTRDFGVTPGLKKSKGAYDLTPEPKYFLELQDATHVNWALFTCLKFGSTQACNAQSPMAQQINEYGIAFLDRYLKNMKEPILSHANPELADFRHAGS